ncbi:hypothetical protein IU427_28215 [Nocardia beijingensis]|uniref:hypothetical protein n=1 Tax=Nocardia beijingensis TaxID=95162 RepID=UPI0018935541|nr:hypothetical protein [Nocardia beijingensis]MBF6469023.1 hypothetical protein [Nocardia beijingensis]
MAGYKIPRLIGLLRALPLDATGKAMKSVRGSGFRALPLAGYRADAAYRKDAA